MFPLLLDAAYERFIFAWFRSNSKEFIFDPNGCPLILKVYHFGQSSRFTFEAYSTTREALEKETRGRDLRGDAKAPVRMNKRSIVNEQTNSTN